MSKIITILIFGVLLNFHPQIAIGQRVSKECALLAASNFLKNRSPLTQFFDAIPLMHNSAQVGWSLNCLPQGFVIISNDSNQPPVLAYSTESNFGDSGIWETLQPILGYDYATRLDYVVFNENELAKNNKKWAELLAPSDLKPIFKQWPPEGWSPTGGWLFTNWTQSAPYNGMCPVDQQTHQRSVAGCPATAMAQVLNFHHTINNTRFSDADDYYHNFGSGNQFWIDNDWESRGFPSWPQLNIYLDTLDAHYMNEILLTNADKAAITYACGVAAKQVYSPSVSGTYGINQAFDAFVRFGFSDALLIYPGDTSLNTHLAQNVIMALPAQLGIVNPEGTAGHNVVVDGYSSDGFYHFNFGWGGSANGWYTMPPTNIPYNLTVIEGIVLDINLSNAPVGINPEKEISTPEISFFPASRTIRIQYFSEKPQNTEITILDIPGRVILKKAFQFTPDYFSIEIILPDQIERIFIICLKTETGISVQRKFFILN